MKNETDALDEAILVLQEKRAHELGVLREHFKDTYTSFKPINLIKSTLKEISASPEIKSDMISNAIGIGTGLIAKRLIVGSSHNPVKRLFGTVLHFAIANVVAKHTGDIKSTGQGLLQRLFKRRSAS
jgi:hypothetical protein